MVSLSGSTVPNVAIGKQMKYSFQCPLSEKTSQKAPERAVYEDRTDKIMKKKSIFDSEANIALFIMLAFMIGLHFYTKLSHRHQLDIVKGKGW